MGQTLTHGVYLPSEGERNCYNGLASNWRLLDGAIGTVAAHTTAIAGKADISHTHGNITNDGKVGTTANVPLITGTGGVVQAGAFGNQANTFCEGNDSRLSDARTPVAHTHTKSDVTDLFNSANTWTGDNTFKGNIYQNQGDANYIIPRGTNTVKGDLTTSGKFTLMFKDKNNGSLATSGIGYLTFEQNSSGSYATIGVETVGSTDNTRHSNSISYRIDPTTNNNTAQFYPVNNNATDLGDSTHQWNNLYAKKVNTQSVNGINPGALSLPGAYQAINDQIKNPSDQLNAIDLNGGSNTWVSDVDCYLYFYIPNNKFTWIRIFWPATLVRCGQTFVPVPNESSDYSGFVPVSANTTVVIQVKGTQAPIFRRSACLGNV